MQPRTRKLAQIVGGAAVLAMIALPAAAKEHHHWRRMARNEHHHWRRTAHDDRPWTVTKRRPAPVAGAPDPFHGPAAIITGPNAAAATVVSLPFRLAGAVFPPYGNPGTNPLMLIGAPIRAAAMIVEFPFYAIGSAFGAPPNVVY